VRLLRRLTIGGAITARALAGARAARDDGPDRRAARLCAVVAEVAAVHDLRITATGAWPSGPAVVVANHVSYLDPLVIASHVPCAPIGKGEVARWPVIGAAARALGVVFVDRGSAASGARALRRGLAALRAGVAVLNFPEGTTTDGTRVLPFRRGSFGLARIAGVPVVPIALRYDPPELAWFGGASFLPHYLRTASRAALRVDVAIGDAIAPRDHASARALADLTHHRIARMLRDLEETDHGPVPRVRVPAPRPDAVLPTAGRAAAGAR
jgi:lyso-ornithine lipid O-acyltransferase